MLKKQAHLAGSYRRSVGTDIMAGRGQEEEEECEDCKLQTILRVNDFSSLKQMCYPLSSGGNPYHVSVPRTYLWAP